MGSSCIFEAASSVASWQVGHFKDIVIVAGVAGVAGSGASPFPTGLLLFGLLAPRLLGSKPFSACETASGADGAHYMLARFPLPPWARRATSSSL